MIDIHSHILPGIDDGAINSAMMFAMLKVAKLVGIDRIVATPHAARLIDLEAIRTIYNRLSGPAMEIGIRIILGCELSIRAFAGYTVSARLLSQYAIADSQFLLLELPVDLMPLDLEYLLSDIKRSGYHVIIAHPERCRYLNKSTRVAESILSYGCELQLDALSFVSDRFSFERRAAIRLLDSGLASYIASDAHRPNDYNCYIKARRLLGNNWPTDGMLEKLL